jgi:hypothetical protein
MPVSALDAAARGVSGSLSMPVYIVDAAYVAAHGLTGGNPMPVVDLAGARSVEHPLIAMPVYVVEGTLGVEPVNPLAHLYDNLTFWLPLDEVSGNRVDAHRGKVFTQIGTIGSSSDPIFGTVGDSTGVAGNSLRRTYDADLAPLANEPYSVAYWFRPDTLTGFKAHFGWYESGDIGGLRALAMFRNGNELLLSKYITVTTSDVITLNSVLSDDTWIFIAFVNDTDNNRIGASMNGGAFTYVASTVHTWVGNWGFNVFAANSVGTTNDNCKMSRVGFWRNLVLDDADATWLYNANAGRVYADVAALGA